MRPGAGWSITSVFRRMMVSPKALAASDRQLASSCRSGSFTATRAQSSAKRKSRTRASRTLVLAFRRLRSKNRPSHLLRTLIPELVLERAANSMDANRRLNSVGAKTQPCFTPLKTGKGSEAAPCSITRAIIPSWKDLMMLTNLSGQPSLDRMAHRPPRLTVSKAFVRSTNNM